MKRLLELARRCYRGGYTREVEGRVSRATWVSRGFEGLNMYGRTSSVCAWTCVVVLSLSTTLIAQDAITIEGGDFTIGEGPHQTTVTATFSDAALSTVLGYQVGLSYDSSVITIDDSLVTSTVPLSLSPVFFSIRTSAGTGSTEHLSVGAVFDFGESGNPTPEHLAGFDNVLSGPDTGVSLLTIPFTEVGGTSDSTTITLTDDPTLQLKNLLTDAAGQSFDVGEGLTLNDGVINLQEMGTGNTRLIGDVNGDGSLNIADPVSGLNFLFGGQSPDVCYVTVLPNLTPFGSAMLDYNGDNAFNIADAVGGLNRLFGGGPPHDLGQGCEVFENTDGCEDNCAI